MLIPYLMKVSLVLAVLTLAYRWLIQFETFSKLNRVLLWLNALASWTLPLISLPSWGPLEMQTEFHHSIPKVVGKLPILAEPITTIQSQSVTATAETAMRQMTAADWINAIYLSGMLLMAVFLLFQMGRLLIIVAKGCKEKYPGGASILHVAGASPFSFFKWIVLDLSKHSGNELRNIIAHETEHARQWHSADLLLAEIQRICLWFNPFAWIHQKLVQENLEYLADRAVLDNGFEKKQYQYNLLNAVMHAHKLPLTNSFAQSLLKKRIKMMNRKPSHYLVWGKYVAVLALIYVSSAFVAPYREEIVELAPEVIRPIVKPLIGEVIAPAETAEDSVTSTVAKEEVSPVPLHAQLAGEASDTIQSAQLKVKGVLIVNQTLYWAITPMMNWEDINALRAEVQKFGQEFQINQLQFDPLQKYITDVSVRIDAKNGSGTGEEHGEAEFAPMKGYSGYISGQGIGMGQLPPDPLSKTMEQDYQQAVAIAKKNEVAYFEYKLGKGLGGHTATTFTRQLLTGPSAETFYNKNGFGKSAENTLRISEYHKNATFYLNTKPSTFIELNEVPFSKIERVTLLEDNARRKYIVVYTE
ncbi:BlaR1 peptidase M56 [Dyadobacter soli]|uniref:BlaR1 peptidase M56 n=1 Tax=Dyadobacter soli TaxID=659014 RepID=A0A1G7HCY8_9BACT|nr:M56 family metallopeptidase [Dyadobacter soli]SDE98248.1 BlaR1 peptidase M56 [Dyadobacter soli]